MRQSHQHPDLTIPLLPDADELPLPHSRPFVHGGLNLREGEDEWPEAGPSRDRLRDGDGDGEESKKRKGKGRVFGAKAVAAMTGAMATSLLMTPFDVLKTRLQTIPPHPSSVPDTAYPPPPPTLPPSSAAALGSNDCCQTTKVISKGQHVANPTTCATAPSLPGRSAPTQASIAFSSLRPSAAPNTPPNGCLNPSKWAGIWGEPIALESFAFGRSGSGPGTGFGGGAGGGASVLVLPQSVERVAATVVTESGTPSVARLGGTFFGEIAAVRREAGIRGLWKGVGTAITMGIPSSAIYMIGYEHLSAIISPYFLPANTPVMSPSRNPDGSQATRSLGASLTPAPLIAGSLARTLSASVISPIEMFRTRLQALPTLEGGSPTYGSVTKDMYRLVQEKGVTILYRGLGPTLWRDVPFSGIYWAGFESLKTFFTSSSSPFPSLSPISTSFISGFLSGTISALLTQPFDVLKTRRQVFDPAPSCAGAEGRVGTVSLVRHVIKTEGWGALYAGTSARCGKVAPACGLMIACYEGVGRLLGGDEE